MEKYISLTMTTGTIARYTVTYGAHLLVREGMHVKKGQQLFRWDPYSTYILADVTGSIKFLDIKENITYREELDEITGLKQWVIIETRNRNMNPHIHILDDNAKKIGNYILPTRAVLTVREGDMVAAGDILAKLPRDIGKTRDITGGLPRVAELFEARKPKEPAVVTEIEGIVQFGVIKRGVRELIVHGKTGEKRTYLVPYGKHVLVHDGDQVEAGRTVDGRSRCAA